jgi:hypothetical protein
MDMQEGSTISLEAKDRFEHFLYQSNCEADSRNDGILPHVLDYPVAFGKARHQHQLS